jgi:hypothetical protein
VTETPDQRVQRLERELAEALEQQAERQAQPAPPYSDWRAGAPQGSMAGSMAGDIGSPAGPVDGFTAGTMDGPLSPPPRRVPTAFIAASLPFRWWEAWALFMIAVTPIALWAAFPWLLTIVGAVTIVVVIALRFRTAWAEYQLLRYGVVATVQGVNQGRTGTYYSGVTYQNVRLAVAHGWRVEREWYSGPGTKTTVDYTVNGRPGSLVLHGLPYQGGVILADPRRPSRARCVSSFPYDLDRDAAGNWIGRVAGGVWVGMAFTVVLWCCWVIGLAYWQLAVVPGLTR